MSLDGRGYVSIIQALAYIPILLVTLLFVARNGVKKQHHWIYLALFSQVRILGAILLIAEEAQNNPSTGLIIAATIVQSTGLSPLILATLGYLSTIRQKSGLFIERFPLSRLVHLVLGTGVVLGTIAGSEADKPKDVNQVSTLRKLSAIIFLLTYIFLAGLHVYLWLNKQTLRPSRKALLVVISSAVPILFLRLIFTLGSAFESASSTTFNVINGSTAIFFIFSVLPEFVAALIYVVAGIWVPLDEEDLELQGKLVFRIMFSEEGTNLKRVLLVLSPDLVGVGHTPPCIPDLSDPSILNLPTHADD